MITWSALTIGGLVSSMIAGTINGYLGDVIYDYIDGKYGLIALWLTLLMTAASTIGWAGIRTPLCRRQTQPKWLTDRPNMNAALWGIDVALALTTRRVFGSSWVLLLVALYTASAVMGATIWVAYWLTRCLCWLPVSRWMSEGGNIVTARQAAIVPSRLSNLVTLGVLGFVVS